jgi:DNA-binding CsgD family transcriptional regulator
MMMSDKQFKEFTRKIDTLIKLTAISALQDRPMARSIQILSETGLRPKEIAQILGTTSHYVSVALSRKKKVRRKRKVKHQTAVSNEKGGETSGESSQGNTSGNIE